MIRNSIVGLVFDSPLFEKVCKRAGQLVKSTGKDVVNEVVSSLTTKLAEEGTSYLLERSSNPKLSFLERWFDIA